MNTPTGCYPYFRAVDVVSWNGDMDQIWMDRLVAVTGWQQERQEIDWGPVEEGFGISPPADYKDICALFAPGHFSAYLEVLRPVGETSSRSLLDSWKYDLQLCVQYPRTPRIYEPYGLYGRSENSGLIHWGSDQTEGDYYWLADHSVDPAGWPVIARKDPAEEWHRFDVPTSEFIYRVLADPEFKPFTVAGQMGQPFLLPYGQPLPWPVE
ncbi:hypothetical protein [Kitasatospora sp. GP82]|uniref:hypothetical protein n=1 Tax=Kitasatospora sp. GP82 TaxID=3035089 RepID=UPI0024745905|nr:hypothetical protein [Kitasatospora sp. GP82]MDH6129198.1 hypothetical protein [Kitasatospora sp. GP82]